MYSLSVLSSFLFATALAVPGSKRLGSDILSDLSVVTVQKDSIGKSVLGTGDAPRLPNFLVEDTRLPEEIPWGNRTTKDTNFYEDVPNTGVTRYYQFEISEGNVAPDGVTRPGMLINAQFPGPTIEANWGDWFEITVYNGLSTEGTTLHWHGLLQTGTPYMDGVPGVSQCPIAPGQTFTYCFRAGLYGTSWYHSHYSAQYADGLLGAIVIYGPSDNVQYDEDLGPIVLGDWYHTPSHTLVEQVMGYAPEGVSLPLPRSNNSLINGRNSYPCNATTLPCIPNAELSKFYVDSRKSYRLRLINAGAEGMLKFSIDGYQLTVFANDFVPVVPYTTDVVTLGVGQRTDVVLYANGSSIDAVWMRSTLGLPLSYTHPGCSVNSGVSPLALAAIYYESADDEKPPTTQSQVPQADIETCANQPLNETVPYFQLATTQEPTLTYVFNITLSSNGTADLFYMNNSSVDIDYNDPLLLETKLGNQQFPARRSVFNTSSSGTVRFVFYNWAISTAHPMHIHGHNAYILAVGNGTWDGVVTNPENPQRRDTQLLPATLDPHVPSYLVMQIDIGNYGIWPFHCHVIWHISEGLGINVLELPIDVEDSSFPETIAQTCRSWGQWTSTDVPDEIDSGL